MAPAHTSSQQWVEKYRPKQIKDVAHQEEVVRALANTLETGSLPHLLFYGPPGTGKTTTALAIAHQLFGPELYKSRVLELNASDDRGINVVRTKIKDFAAVAVACGGTNSGYLCPPFKIIILDEADSMTEDAQNALRRTMETHSKVTRFCFICNYVSRIIEPLASRCAKFRFKPLVEDIMTNRILHICKEEGLHLDSDALRTLGSVSEGDLRRAITCLQSAARLYGSSISSNNIISVSGIIPIQVVQSLFQACKTGQFDMAQKEVTDIVAEGHPASQIFSQLYDLVVQATDISDETKARISQRLAEADKCLIDGADEYLQLLDVASNAMRALCNMTQECCY
uniref:AAA+ ATPase domain-containing protein n=1 Tax=Araucaria cunninghamii TaxID=56994 RepID=A0A0D6R900_ARACU